MKTLVLSGGGIKGISMLGLLQRLYKEGRLNNITKYIGTSVGSIISLLLSIGFTPLEIYNMSNRLNLNLSSIKDMISEYGIISTSTVSDIMRFEIKNKLGHVPTLLEHHKMTNKHYISVVTNLSKSKVEYIDYINNPDIDCVLACEMSFSIPFVFKCVRYNNDVYVDGGLLDNFAIDYQYEHEERLGICLGCHYEIDSIFNFATRILDTAFQLKADSKIDNMKDKCEIYKIEIGRTISSKRNLFKIGSKTDRLV